MNSSLKTTLTALCVCLAAIPALAQPQFQTNSPMGFATLHPFTNSAHPNPIGLTLGADGFLYGTLTGPAVYQMTTNGVTNWTTPLSFSQTGNVSNLFQAPDGNLYLPGTAAIVSLSSGGSLNWVLPPTNNGIVRWLIPGADGNLYGASPAGGTNNLGEIVSIAPSGSYNWSVSFDTTNRGSVPSGPPIQGRDGNLYGALTNGSLVSGHKFGYGAIYSLSTNGTLNWVLNLTNLSGLSPLGSIMQGADGRLYCPARGQFGSVLCVSTNGALAWTFPLPNTNGFSTPDGSLIQGTDGNLYLGGGSVFSLSTNGAFRWSLPLKGSIFLQRLDGSICGAVIQVGPYNIFSLTTTGQTNAVQVLNNIATPGLVQDAAGNLYGAATPFVGGTAQIFELVGPPRIFALPTDVLDATGGPASFAVSVTGAPPLSPQWQKNGTNLADGANILGSQSNRLSFSSVSSADVGAYTTTASNSFGVATTPAVLLVTNASFPTLLSNAILSQPNPTLFPYKTSTIAPYALAAGADGSLYGSTLEGQIFHAQTNGAILWSDSTTFGNEITSLSQGYDGNIYAENGAAYYIYSTNGSVIHQGSTGLYASGIVQAPNHIFYWTKATSPAAIFAVSNNFTLWSFTNFSNPDDVILGADGTLYAASGNGGDYRDGAVFSLSPSGDLLWSFSFAGTNGLAPEGLVLAHDYNLYGLTAGLSNNLGGVFSLSTNGGFLWYVPFSSTNGSFPVPSLTQAADGYLYGATQGGGAFGFGTLFRISTNGDLASIYSFTGGIDGAHPQSSPVQVAPGVLYGVTPVGGPANDGVLYRLDLSSGAAPSPAAPIFTSVTLAGANLYLTFAAVPPQSYQLQVSPDLLSWSNLGPAILASQSSMTVTDTISAAPQHFYRLHTPCRQPPANPSGNYGVAAEARAVMVKVEQVGAMYKKILVALENSQTDRALLPHVSELARQFHSELLLVHVADGWAARNYDRYNLADSSEMKADREFLERTAEELRRQGVTVSTHLALGDPSTEILRSSEKERCDLIAMTTHGHRFIADLVLGSTIEAVRHKSLVPVFLVHARASTPVAADAP